MTTTITGNVLASFEPIIDKILAVEGEAYTDHADDSGGPTKWGITQAVARANGYHDDMRELPEAFARQVYRSRYIVRPNFDRVALIEPGIAWELIDTGVNMGPRRAIEFLQRALNAFNQRGSRYADIPVDGDIGPATLAALTAFIRHRGHDGVAVMLRSLNALQCVFYIELAESRPKDESFVYGQILHRVHMEGASA